MFEQLEGRRMLAANAGNAGGNKALEFTLSPEGELVINNARNVFIDDHDGRYPDGETLPDGTVVLTDVTTSMIYIFGDDADEPLVTSITVNGTSRDDRFSASLVTDIPVAISGGAGDDQFIIGGEGNGPLTLHGGSGTDEFIISALAQDGRTIDIIGGPGRDTFNSSPID